MLIRVSTDDALAVELDELKMRFRVTTDDDDETLEKLIRSETERYEDYTGRVMVPGDFEWRACGWNGLLCIPVTPVREVREVGYFDLDDVERTLSADQWSYDLSSEGVVVRFSPDFERPALSDRLHPVIVRLSAGYDVPGVSGSGDDPALASSENDQRNIMLLVRRIYDTDETMPDADFRKFFGNRRIYR